MSALVCPSCRGTDSTLVSMDDHSETRRCMSAVCGRLFTLDRPRLPSPAEVSARLEESLLGYLAEGFPPHALAYGVLAVTAERAAQALSRAGLVIDADEVNDRLAMVRRLVGGDDPVLLEVVA